MPNVDEALQEIATRIAEMAHDTDDDPAIPAGDLQWRKGYKQACSDIVLIVCRAADKHRPS